MFPGQKIPKRFHAMELIFISNSLLVNIFPLKHLKITREFFILNYALMHVSHIREWPYIANYIRSVLRELESKMKWIRCCFSFCCSLLWLFSSFPFKQKFFYKHKKLFEKAKRTFKQYKNSSIFSYILFFAIHFCKRRKNPFTQTRKITWECSCVLSRFV